MFDKTVSKMVVIAVSVAIAAGTVWASNQDIESQYSKLKDEYQKKEFLLKLNSKPQKVKMYAASPDVRQETASVEKVLALGLSDESAVVVEQAILGIAKNNCSSLAPRLIPMYRNAQKLFKGYAERIRIAIVSTLGTVDGNTTVEFLGDILSKDNGTILGQKILNAIKELNDQQLSDAVAKYAEKMESKVELGRKAGHDPFLYSNAQQNAEIAREVLSSLTTR